MTHCTACRAARPQSARLLSLFDSLGPIMSGPSSSHTAGMARIGRMGRSLVGGTPERITLHFFGALSHTYKGHASDSAVVAGLIGEREDSPNVRHALRLAAERGVEVEIRTHPDSDRNPNTVSMELTRGGRTYAVVGVSVGGGEIEITRLNGSDILLRGKRRETICLGPEGARVVPEDASAGPGQWLARLEPLFPFPQQEGAVPFRTAQEMFAYARDTGRPLWRVAFDYESALTGGAEAELRAYARQVLDICRHARQQGVCPDNHFIGVTDARAARYKALREGRKLIDLGAADEACLDAMSIMEFSNAHGTIVCMPTGGASGIVPAAVYRIGERLGKPETEQENALLVAGLIGAFYYPTHYTGAIGCQAEIGVAVSMASAALCSMMTDDPDTIHCAASLGGQVLMGLLCNPIEGYVQVPCIVRNMAAVPTAVTCANAALAGMDHIVPLDDVVALMLAVGEKIRPCDEAGTVILKKEEE